MISYKISNEIKKRLKEDEDKEQDNLGSNENNKDEKEALKEEISSTKESNINLVQDDNESIKKEKVKNVNDIINDLYEIKNKYNSVDEIEAPESLNLEKIDYKEVSDEELNKMAKDSLAQKYNQKIESTNQSFANKIDEIIKNSDSLKEQNKTSIDKVNSYYDNSIKETENQALKRGLARSSIIISEISNIEGSRAGELANILENLQNSLFENEVKLSNLENQKQQALNNLDIEYAVELDQKISSLSEDYAKKKEEAIKFNNNVEKLEAEYKLSLDKQKLDKKKQNLALKEKYGEDLYKQEISDKQYAYLKNYFDTLDPKYAFSVFLANKEFKTILGDNYSTMYKYLSSKF